MDSIDRIGRVGFWTGLSKNSNGHYHCEQGQQRPARAEVEGCKHCEYCLNWFEMNILRSLIAATFLNGGGGENVNRDKDFFYIPKSIFYICPTIF
jgi:D-arabinose 1-dehydrogenase-like Zn-dependent alcohol dehydrogenase